MERIIKGAVKFREVMRADTGAVERTASRDFYKVEFTGLNISYMWRILELSMEC